MTNILVDLVGEEKSSFTSKNKRRYNLVGAVFF